MIAYRDEWNTWHKDLRSPQNRTVKQKGFVATGSPRAMDFTRHDKSWLKPIARPLKTNMTTWYKNCSYFAQIKSTTAIDNWNRRWHKIWLGCSRKATAPLIVTFKLVFRWLTFGRHFEGIAYFHNRHSPKHTSKILIGNQYLWQNMCKNYNLDQHFYHHQRSFICREESSAGTNISILQGFPQLSF